VLGVRVEGKSVTKEESRLKSKFGGENRERRDGGKLG